MINKLSKILIITLCVLLIPLIATLISDEWNWGVGDFLIGAILIFSSLLLISYVYEKLKNSKYRIPIIIGISLICLWIWAELAVGILF